MAEGGLSPEDLARVAVENYVRSGELTTPPDGVGEALNERAGAFVCLKRQDHLRGCIGTIMPQTENLAVEIVRNAVQAASADPRFLPIEESELEQLHYTVDVLSTPEPVDGPEALDPAVYGCIVSTSDGRKGLLLPDLEGIDTVDKQVMVCRQKGGIRPDESVLLERFTVTRYGE